jgi:hypothetical protein
MIILIHDRAQTQLPGVAEAFSALGLQFCIRQRRQQQRRQDGNNGNNHQQLNQGEGGARFLTLWFQSISMSNHFIPNHIFQAN